MQGKCSGDPRQAQGETGHTKGGIHAQMADTGLTQGENTGRAEGGMQALGKQTISREETNTKNNGEK